MTIEENQVDESRLTLETTGKEGSKGNLQVSPQITTSQEGHCCLSLTMTSFP
ncbi:MAG: hypothetical protein KAT58_03920 [candidate division Zixibacteria bacterium]|nr:hypothetical protein [candidate division Zixibacteria bacterium]